MSCDIYAQIQAGLVTKHKIFSTVLSSQSTPSYTAYRIIDMMLRSRQTHHRGLI